MANQSQTRTASGQPSRWTPYLVGVGIGVLSWIVFVVVANPIGITTSIGQIAGGVMTPIIGPEAVSTNAYWKSNVMKLDYGTLFLIGTFFGALASSLISRTFVIETIPTVWLERFGPSKVKRYLAALAMYGARMAGGCTSGNGISQGLQLAAVGWTFLMVMFTSGLITAAIVFRAHQSK